MIKLSNKIENTKIITENTQTATIGPIKCLQPPSVHNKNIPMTYTIILTNVEIIIAKKTL